MLKRFLWILVFYTLNISHYASSAIYKCVEPNGRPIFSDKRCPDDTEAISVSPINTSSSARTALASSSVLEFQKTLRKGDYEKAQQMLTNTPLLVNTMIPYLKQEGPPLHFASKLGDIKMVQLLMAHGADIHALDSRGEPVLHAAFQNPTGPNVDWPSRYAVTRFLIEQGATIDINTPEGLMLLRTAAARGDTYVVDWMLKRDIPEREMVAAMSSAAYFNQASTLKQLIAAGGDVNSHLFGGDLLLDAVEANRVSTTNILLEAGADVTKLRKNPLRVAAKLGHQEVSALLIKHGVSPNVKTGPLQLTPLIIAVQHRQLSYAEWLLRNGAEVDGRSKTGETALHFAAKTGDTQCIQLLKRYGADSTLRDLKGQTARDEALQNNHQSLLQFL